MTRGYSVISLFRPQKECNIGGVLRAAHCFDADAVIIEGKFRKQASNTTEAQRHLPVFETSDMWTNIPYSCVPIAVEYIQDSKSLIDFVHPERAFYIFGPENGSIPNRILTKCVQTVYIPTKFCLNLASCVNVLLYDRMVKNYGKSR